MRHFEDWDLVRVMLQNKEHDVTISLSDDDIIIWGKSVPDFIISEDKLIDILVWVYLDDWTYIDYLDDYKSKFFNIDWIEFSWNTTIEEVIETLDRAKEQQEIEEQIEELIDEIENDIDEENEFMIESIIATMDNYRKRTHWDFKNAETFWKYYHNELRDLLQKTYL